MIGEGWEIGVSGVYEDVHVENLGYQGNGCVSGLPSLTFVLGLA